MNAPGLIATVRQAAAQMMATAQATHGDVQAQLVANAKKLQANVEQWATEQLARVTRGEKPEKWWTDYGESLLRTAIGSAEDNQGFFSKWSGAIIEAGKAPLAIEKSITGAIDDGRARVRKFAQQLKQFDQQMAQIERQREALKKNQKSLSAEAQSVLFGAQYSAASAALSQFRGLVQGLQKVFAALDSGHAVTKTGNDFIVDDKAMVSGLGNPLVVAGGVGTGAVIATIAVAASIAATLIAYFNHANQVITGEESSSIAKLVSSGKMTPKEAAALATSLAALHKAGSPDPFGGIPAAAKAIGGVIVVGGVVFIGWKAWPYIEDWLKSRRRAAA